MPSFQAQVVRAFLKLSDSRRRPVVSNPAAHRRTFECSMRLLFPSTARGVTIETIAGRTVLIARPPHKSLRSIVYLHGGGFVHGSSLAMRQHLKRLARMTDATVFGIDYRLSPESPYPAALDDITTVIDTLAGRQSIDPKHTVYMGNSSGGNLALATALRQRDNNQPLPAALVLLSPGLDATLSGASHTSNAALDHVLNAAKLNYFVTSYVGSADRHDPLISPVFADLHGLPPMLIQAGSDELLLSDSKTLYANAQKDGVAAQLAVHDAMWHGWQLFAGYVPEAYEAMREVATFVARHS